MGHWLNKHLDFKIPWTTISGMVGHLEELRPTTAVFVVALIAPVGFYTLVPSKQGHRSRLGRRYLRAPPEKEPLNRYNASVVLAL